MDFIKSYGTTHFHNDGNELQLTGYIRSVMLNIPTKFEVILKELNFCEILGILSSFDLRTINYTFMVLKCMKFTRKTISVQNCNGLGLIKIYSAYLIFKLWEC